MLRKARDCPTAKEMWKNKLLCFRTTHSTQQIDHSMTFCTAEIHESKDVIAFSDKNFQLVETHKSMKLIICDE